MIDKMLFTLKETKNSPQKLFESLNKELLEIKPIYEKIISTIPKTFSHLEHYNSESTFLDCTVLK